MPEQETPRLDCGHEAGDGEAVSLPEVTICRECYTPFSVEDYPAVLDSAKRFAGVNYHGSAEYVTYRTRILGLDKHGHAVYHRERDKRILYVGPVHDRHFDTQDDRRPLRDKHTKPEPAPAPYDPDFHTLPNGDHIAIADYEAVDFGYTPGPRLGRWLVDRLREDPDGRGFDVLTESAANRVRQTADDGAALLEQVKVVAGP